MIILLSFLVGMAHAGDHLFACRVRALYPDAKAVPAITADKQFTLEDRDGQTFIRAWSYAGAAKPTATQLAAVTTQATVLHAADAAASARSVDYAKEIPAGVQLDAILKYIEARADFAAGSDIALVIQKWKAIRARYPAP